MTNLSEFDESMTFQLFPKLPESIRQRIWYLALPEPRLVEICFDPKRGGEFHGIAYQILMLEVNKEARAIAEAAYPLSFSVDNAPPYVRFDFTQDCLLLGRGLGGFHIKFRKECKRSDLERVQELMVDAELDWKNRNANGRAERNFCQLSFLVFRGLKQYTALYTGHTDPLPIITYSWGQYARGWISQEQISTVRSYENRIPATDPENMILWLTTRWNLLRFGGVYPNWRIELDDSEKESYRFGGIPVTTKLQPAILRWPIPRVFSIGVNIHTIGDLGMEMHPYHGPVQRWAMLLMDRAIDDIFE